MPNRKIYRHSSNEGSVIEFNMYGKAVKLFVADAKYRAVKPWRTYGADTSLDNFRGDYRCINPIADGDDRGGALSYNLTDQEIQTRFRRFMVDKTAKENTDALMTYDDTEAAHWCRAQNISGVGDLDLPNAYELMVIYLESDRLDALDPTASSYPQYMLGCKNPNGRFSPESNNRYWTSTEVSAERAITVDNEGDLNINNGVKTSARGVLPVKEIW